MTANAGAAAAPEKCGEVMESATAAVLAQSYELNVAPPFGSLVWMPRGEEGAVFGVVTGVETRSLDPGRRPVARGHDAASLPAILERHPQLTELFRTHFSIRVVGFAAGGVVSHGLPPLPPEVHQLVYPCTRTQVRVFVDGPGWLPVLLGNPSPDANEVTAAFLRYAAAQFPAAEATAFLVAAAKHLVALLRGETPRLNYLLGRLA